MKSIEKNLPEAPSAPEVEFKGYTMAELRYQRALLLIRREFVKEKALKELEDIKKRVPIINGKSPLNNSASGNLVGKLLRGLNFADYIILGYQVLRIGRKIGSKIRRR